jgi:hypothetical protein
MDEPKFHRYLGGIPSSSERSFGTRPTGGRLSAVRRAAVLLGVMLLIPALASTAALASVIHTSGPFSKTVTVSGLCAFPVVFHVEGINQETDFTDAQGRLVEAIQTGVISLTFSANGKTLSSPGAGPVIAMFDPSIGDLTSLHIAGLGFRVTLPGTGVVLLNAGTFSINAGGTFSVAGPLVQDPAFCGALI